MRLSKRAREELVDGGPAVVAEKARAGSREMRVPHDRTRLGDERVTAPAPPAAAVLVEDVERLVEELGVLGGDARAAGDGVVGVDRAHDEDLLAVVHLMPDRLQ